MTKTLYDPNILSQAEEQFVNSFNALSNENHHRMRAQGFWDMSDRIIQLCQLNGLGREAVKMRKSQLRDLIVSELGEACEGDRKDLVSEHLSGFSNAEEEYADVIIRLFDVAQGMGLKIAEAVVAKMRYNLTRPHRHGDKAF